MWNYAFSILVTWWLKPHFHTFAISVDGVTGNASRQTFFLAKSEGDRNFAFGLPKHCWLFPSINIPVLIPVLEEQGWLLCLCHLALSFQTFQKRCLLSSLPNTTPSSSLRRSSLWERLLYFLSFATSLPLLRHENTRREKCQHYITCISSQPHLNNSPVHQERDSQTSREAGG